MSPTCRIGKRWLFLAGCGLRKAKKQCALSTIKFARPLLFFPRALNLSPCTALYPTLFPSPSPGWSYRQVGKPKINFKMKLKLLFLWFYSLCIFIFFITFAEKFPVFISLVLSAYWGTLNSFGRSLNWFYVKAKWVTWLGLAMSGLIWSSLAPSAFPSLRHQYICCWGMGVRNVAAASGN